MPADPLLRADEITRRHFLSGAARTLLGVHLAPMLGPTIADAATQASPKAKAKHVIYLFMDGGMSHVDTFDPKPTRREVMGPTNAIPTNADGILVGHYLPETAKVMDRVCVINSMNSTQGAHEQGSYIMHTSYALRGTIEHPSLGSWVLKTTGRIHKDLPGYVAIDSSPETTGAGFFGSKYAAAPIGSPREGLKDSRRHPQVTKQDFDRRLSLADKLNRNFHKRLQSTPVKEYEELYREAVSLMNSKDLAAFDISQEPAATRALYGEGRFAQGCLLARRLVEHGVRFVEVQLGGWDTHYDNFTGVAGRCAEFDKAYAALITDLAKSGKLAETLVVVATEFGRTPEINPDHQQGRDHHPSAFTCLLAGGGVKGGYKHGSTDSKGMRVRKDPVTVQDFNATIAHALGIHTGQIVMSPSRRPFRIADTGKPVLGVFA
jgi:hypothetical protein